MIECVLCGMYFRSKHKSFAFAICDDCQKENPASPKHEFHKDFECEPHRPPKYVLCPGFVSSKSDGDKHYISARQLSVLYGVRMEDCIIEPDMGFRPTERNIFLYPNEDGNYTLPER